MYLIFQPHWWPEKGTDMINDPFTATYQSTEICDNVHQLEMILQNKEMLSFILLSDISALHIIAKCTTQNGTGSYWSLF